MSDKTAEETNPNTGSDDLEAASEGKKLPPSPAKSQAPKAEGAVPAKAEEEKQGGLGPAVLAGVGILAVVAALVFWPSDDDKDGKGKSADARNSAAAAQGRSGDEKDGAGAKGPGGVGARNVDDANRESAGAAEAGGQAESQYKLNPAVRLPPGIGMAPAVPKEEPPPKFDNKEDEIAWWEAKLMRANTQLEMRKKATERLAKWKERAAASENPDEEMARYDQRAEVVNENLRKAQERVADLEKKVAELKGE